LVKAVRSELEAAGDPAKAGPMQVYMKSELPYRGVQSPGVKRICRDLFAAHPLGTREVWEATVRALWDEASYREERYVAIALTGYRLYREWQDIETLDLYDHLITSGAWWDYVDELAIRRVGPILRSHPESVTPVLLLWARDNDIWRRRTAIIAQIGAGDALDARLLMACIEPSLGRTEFFLRKAIGWALRQHARIDPDWVRAYVSRHGSELSPLSRREAMKHL
jgi:3-methyladenine DNA glycosylase AlkD